MPQLLTAELAGKQEYRPVLISLIKTLFKNPIEWVQAPVPTFTQNERKVIGLEPFTYGNYKTIRDIQCSLKITQQSVIVRCLPVHIFSYARTSDEALENFKSLLIDYYKHLKRRKKNLGKNLLQELEYLESIIVQKSK